jgi:putative transposase
MFTGRPERLRDLSYIGFYRYFLTFGTFERRSVFICHSRVDPTLLQIRRAAVEQRFALAAYCFMPDHLHLLIQGEREDSDGKRFIKAAKQYSGFYYKKAFNESLWQRYGYEHTLRSDDQTLGVVRYIIENPVRAGLVKHVEDYPFVGSFMYTVREILDAVVVDPH